MGGKKPVDLNRKYEKIRRDRMNTHMSELNSLLPGYSSSEPMTKAKIFENTIKYIRKLKETVNDEAESSEICELKKKVAYLMQLIRDLLNLLRQSHIRIPDTIRISDELTLQDGYNGGIDMCQNNKIGKENVQPIDKCINDGVISKVTLNNNDDDGDSSDDNHKGGKITQISDQISTDSSLVNRTKTNEISTSSNKYTFIDKVCTTSLYLSDNIATSGIINSIVQQDYDSNDNIVNNNNSRNLSNPVSQCNVVNLTTKTILLPAAPPIANIITIPITSPSSVIYGLPTIPTETRLLVNFASPPLVLMQSCSSLSSTIVKPVFITNNRSSATIKKVLPKQVHDDSTKTTYVNKKPIPAIRSYIPQSTGIVGMGALAEKNLNLLISNNQNERKRRPTPSKGILVPVKKRIKFNNSGITKSNNVDNASKKQNLLHKSSQTSHSYSSLNGTLSTAGNKISEANCVITADCNMNVNNDNHNSNRDVLNVNGNNNFGDQNKASCDDNNSSVNGVIDNNVDSTITSNNHSSLNATTIVCENVSQIKNDNKISTQSIGNSEVHPCNKESANHTTYSDNYESNNNNITLVIDKAVQCDKTSYCESTSSRINFNYSTSDQNSDDYNNDNNATTNNKSDACNDRHSSIQCNNKTDLIRNNNTNNNDNDYNLTSNICNKNNNIDREIFVDGRVATGEVETMNNNNNNNNRNKNYEDDMINFVSHSSANNTNIDDDSLQLHMQCADTNNIDNDGNLNILSVYNELKSKIPCSIDSNIGMVSTIVRSCNSKQQLLCLNASTNATVDNLLPSKQVINNNSPVKQVDDRINNSIEEVSYNSVTDHQSTILDVKTFAVNNQHTRLSNKGIIHNFPCSRQFDGTLEANNNVGQIKQQSSSTTENRITPAFSSTVGFNAISEYNSILDDNRIINYNKNDKHNNKEECILSDDNHLSSYFEDDIRLSLQSTEFSNDLLSSLQIPSNEQHQHRDHQVHQQQIDSVSPTASFLLSFPVVSSSRNDLLTENVCDDSSCSSTSILDNVESTSNGLFVDNNINNNYNNNIHDIDNSSNKSLSAENSVNMTNINKINMKNQPIPNCTLKRNESVTVGNVLSFSSQAFQESPLSKSSVNYSVTRCDSTALRNKNNNNLNNNRPLVILKDVDDNDDDDDDEDEIEDEDDEDDENGNNNNNNNNNNNSTNSNNNNNGEIMVVNDNSDYTKMMNSMKMSKYNQHLRTDYENEIISATTDSTLLHSIPNFTNKTSSSVKSSLSYLHHNDSLTPTYNNSIIVPYSTYFAHSDICSQSDKQNFSQSLLVNNNILQDHNEPLLSLAYIGEQNKKNCNTNRCSRVNNNNNTNSNLNTSPSSCLKQNKLVSSSIINDSGKIFSSALSSLDDTTNTLCNNNVNSGNNVNNKINNCNDSLLAGTQNFSPSSLSTKISSQMTNSSPSFLFSNMKDGKQDKCAMKSVRNHQITAFNPINWLTPSDVCISSENSLTPILTTSDMLIPLHKEAEISPLNTIFGNSVTDHDCNIGSSKNFKDINRVVNNNNCSTVTAIKAPTAVTKCVDAIMTAATVITTTTTTTTTTSTTSTTTTTVTGTITVATVTNVIATITNTTATPVTAISTIITTSISIMTATTTNTTIPVTNTVSTTATKAVTTSMITPVINITTANISIASNTASFSIATTPVNNVAITTSTDTIVTSVSVTRITTTTVPTTTNMFFNAEFSLDSTFNDVQTTFTNNKSQSFPVNIENNYLWSPTKSSLSTLTHLDTHNLFMSPSTTLPSLIGDLTPGPSYTTSNTIMDVLSARSNNSFMSSANYNIPEFSKKNNNNNNNNHHHHHHSNASTIDTCIFNQNNSHINNDHHKPELTLSGMIWNPVGNEKLMSTAVTTSFHSNDLSKTNSSQITTSSSNGAGSFLSVTQLVNKEADNVKSHLSVNNIAKSYSGNKNNNSNNNVINNNYNHNDNNSLLCFGMENSTYNNYHNVQNYCGTVGPVTNVHQIPCSSYCNISTVTTNNNELCSYNSGNVLPLYSGNNLITVGANNVSDNSFSNCASSAGNHFCNNGKMDKKQHSVTYQNNNYANCNSRDYKEEKQQRWPNNIPTAAVTDKINNDRKQNVIDNNGRNNNNSNNNNGNSVKNSCSTQFNIISNRKSSVDMKNYDSVNHKNILRDNSLCSAKEKKTNNSGRKANINSCNSYHKFQQKHFSSNFSNCVSSINSNENSLTNNNKHYPVSSSQSNYSAESLLSMPYNGNDNNNHKNNNLSCIYSPQTYFYGIDSYSNHTNNHNDDNNINSNNGNNNNNNNTGINTTYSIGNRHKLNVNDSYFPNTNFSYNSFHNQSYNNLNYSQTPVCTVGSTTMVGVGPVHVTGSTFIPEQNVNNHTSNSSFYHSISKNIHNNNEIGTCYINDKQHLNSYKNSLFATTVNNNNNNNNNANSMNTNSSNYQIMANTINNNDNCWKNIGYKQTAYTSPYTYYNSGNTSTINNNITNNSNNININNNNNNCLSQRKLVNMSNVDTNAYSSPCGTQQTVYSSAVTLSSSDNNTFIDQNCVNFNGSFHHKQQSILALPRADDHHTCTPMYGSHIVMSTCSQQTTIPNATVSRRVTSNVIPNYSSTTSMSERKQNQNMLPNFVSGNNYINSNNGSTVIAHPSSATSLTNFNLSAIFPEINDKQCHNSTVSDNGQNAAHYIHTDLC